MSSEELQELKKISKILTIAHAEVIEGKLSKIATSDDRKRMWVLIDGAAMPGDIAERVRVTPMSVSRFLNTMKMAGYVEYKPRRPPRKIIDYVPPDWIELVELPTVEEEGSSGEGNE